MTVKSHDPKTRHAKSRASHTELEIMQVLTYPISPLPLLLHFSPSCNPVLPSNRVRFNGALSVTFYVIHCVTLCLIFLNLRYVFTSSAPIRQLFRRHR